MTVSLMMTIHTTCEKMIDSYNADPKADCHSSPYSAQLVTW